MSSADSCVRCGAPAGPGRVCPPCVTAWVRESRGAQGVSEPGPEVGRLLAALRPKVAA